MGEEASPYLLLLPLSSQPPSRKWLSSTYREPFTSALKRLKDPQRSSTLLIAVAGHFLKSKSGDDTGERRLSWADAQSTLAGLYSLVSLICAEESIASDIHAGPNAVDTRIILVDDDAKSPSVINRSIIRPIAEFASADAPPWNLIFYPKTDDGRGLLERFLSFTPGGQASIEQLVLVGLDLGDAAGRISGQPGTVTQTHTHTRTRTHADDVQASYRVVCLGGTFDHLHPGHKLLLAAAALLLKVPVTSECSCRFIIGITGDQLLKNKKFAELVQSWEVRARGVLEFLGWVIESPRYRTTNLTKAPGQLTATFRSGTISVECVEIQDAFGPTITLEDMDALVVSGETRSGGQAVNEKREGLGWKALEIFEVDVLGQELSDDDGHEPDNFASKISSTAIREQKATAAAEAAATATAATAVTST